MKRYAPNCKFDFSNVAFQIRECPSIQRWDVALADRSGTAPSRMETISRDDPADAGSHRLALGKVERRIREFGFAVHLMRIVYISFANTKIGFT